MRKIIALFLTMLLVVALFVGCGKDEPATDETTDTTQEDATTEETTDETSDDAAVEAGSLADGFYYAQEDEFADSGWKGAIVIEVADGKMVDINWTAISKTAGVDKKTASMNGAYGMVEYGGAIAEWHEQAEAVENYLLETQDVTAIEYKDDEGHVDVISGVTIHVNDFYALAEKALANGPQEKGPYTDGAYHAEEDQFADSGWKGTIDVTVLFGDIVAVNWSAVDESGADKKEASMNGEYGMVEKAGASAEWHEQAEAVENYLLETQDVTAIEYVDDEGHVDVISGVSIHVNDFYALAEKALADAK
ncbi:FMN-binding protein [Vallitaleaceae bacterium 9-2]